MQPTRETAPRYYGKCDAELSWRLYYGNRTAYGSKDGSPFDVPSRTDVQVLVKATPNHPTRPFRCVYGQDNYYWDRINGWVACDWTGLWDYLMSYKGPQSVLFGRSKRDDLFWECIEWAKREGLG